LVIAARCGTVGNLYSSGIGRGVAPAARRNLPPFFKYGTIFALAPDTPYS
jgi:hypothetical protein